MTARPILESRDLSGADAAFERAAEQARRVAELAGTPLVVYQDGRKVHLTPEESRNPRAATRLRDNER